MGFYWALTCFCICLLTILSGSANPVTSTRNYVLNASFPPKPLSDESQTLQDAGLLNAVVIQKFQ